MLLTLQIFADMPTEWNVRCDVEHRARRHIQMPDPLCLRHHDHPLGVLDADEVVVENPGEPVTPSSSDQEREEQHRGDDEGRREPVSLEPVASTSIDLVDLRSAPGCQ